MKINLYMDVWPGQQPGGYYAYSIPPTKLPGTTRYLITVNLPDINKPDAILPVQELLEVVDKE
jgi:hypothetical protein